MTNFLEERCGCCNHKRKDHGIGGGRCNRKTSKSKPLKPDYDCNCVSFQAQLKEEE